MKFTSPKLNVLLANILILSSPGGEGGRKNAWRIGSLVSMGGRYLRKISLQKRKL